MSTHAEIIASAERLLRRVSMVKSQRLLRGRESLQASIRALREAHASIRDPDNDEGGENREGDTHRAKLFDIQDMSDSEDEDPGREPTRDEILASGERLLRRVSGSHGSIKSAESLEASIQALREAHRSMQDEEEDNWTWPRRSTEELEPQVITSIAQQLLRDPAGSTPDRTKGQVEGSPLSPDTVVPDANLRAQFAAFADSPAVLTPQPPFMAPVGASAASGPVSSPVQTVQPATAGRSETSKNRGPAFTPDPMGRLRVQEETLAALRAMNANIVRMAATLEDREERAPPRAAQNQDAPPRQPPLCDEDELDRCIIRLDGLEVYAVVSALTTATSITCFDAFAPHDWEVLWSSGEYLLLAGDMAFLLSSVTGIVAGMHATLVFSLMTMYGRTALGTDRDDAFGTFFAGTGVQRYRGFQSFLFSLYAFLLQLVVLVTTKTPMVIRALAFLGSSFVCHRVYRDTEDIIDAAGIIFAPATGGGSGTDRPSKTAKRQWEEQSWGGRSSLKI